jgi:hypothetical protein
VGDAEPGITGKPASELMMRDYVEAASGASSRTRNVTVTLVIVTILMSIGMLNSLYHSWAGARVLASADPYGEYVTDNIGPVPTSALQRQHMAEHIEARRKYDERYHEFYSAIVKSYVDTGFAIRVPFFGLAIDVNDLGFLGGFALLVILAMYDFCIAREGENLSVAFQYGLDRGELAAAYDLLAMHQLFTVPRRSPSHKRRFTSVVPKIICTLPFVVQMIVVGHDIYTNSVGVSLDNLHNTILLYGEVVWCAVMFPVTAWLVLQLVNIDRLWDDWSDVRFSSVSKPVPESFWTRRFFPRRPR